MRDVCGCTAVERTAMILVAPLLLVACASSDFGLDQNARLPEDAPNRFMVGEINEETTREATPGEGCRSPMVDPRNGTRLQLIRSSRDQGDYSVPNGKYGANEGELLRLNCESGEVVGFVVR